MTTTLNEDQIARFHDQGLLIVDFNIDHQMLDTIVAKVETFYDSGFKSHPAKPTRLIDGWKLVDEVRQLAVNPSVLSALEQLFERKPLPFQTLNFPIGTGQATHADTIHFNSDPPGFMAGVWVALEDIDRDNGPLEYYPGSHKLAELTMQDFGLRATVDDYPKYELAVKEEIKQQNLAVEYGLIKKGQAIIWHPNLFHGGAPQNDEDRTRHSQVTHFFFENCQYYTPMHSEPGKLAMRNPIWIPNKHDAKIAAKALRGFHLEQRRLQGKETLTDRLMSSLRAVKRKLFSTS